jgi:two-component system OmpR family sensor kinase
VTNAFKYSPEPEPIEVQVRCDERSVLLRVVDHGPGIPAHERDRVFERFARLEGGAARPGLGLGLYIVRIISENHGGCVRVEETPGGGATFVVELPLAGHVIEGEMVIDQDAAAAGS